MMNRHVYLILCTAVAALLAVFAIDTSRPLDDIVGAAKTSAAESALKAIPTPESTPKPIFLSPGEGRIIQGVGDGPQGQLIFKLGGGESGSTFELAEDKTPPSGGPPEHIHLETDEAFYVLTGTFRVKVGNQVKDVEPGSFVFAPRGIPHAFVNTGETEGKLLIVDSPTNWEACMREVTDALRRMPRGNPDQKALNAIMDKYKVKIVGPPLTIGVQPERQRKP